MTGAPWGDDRLAAAFAELASAHLAPADIVSTTTTALVVPRRSPFLRRFVASAALVAATVAVIGGGILGYQAVRPTVPSGTSPATGQTATSSPESAGPTAPARTPVPSNTLLALPVIGVGEAIAVRDVGIDDSEIAVRGWYLDGGPVPCPYDPVIVNPLQPSCPDDRVWLMRDPDVLFISDANGGETMRQPTGPALNPDLDKVDPGAWGPPSGAGAPLSVERVMVGHFDDPLAATCPAEARQACRDRFVVDQVWAPDGGPRLDTTPDSASVLPAISVSDALTVRDNGTDRHEIAVRGWYSDNPATPCMGRYGPIVIDPLQMTCFDDYVWLLAGPERLPVVESDTGVAPQPIGPAFHPFLGRIGRSWIGDQVTPGQGVLLDVVMVGHFDDAQAATCPKGAKQACRDRFVVDQVWSGDRNDLLATAATP